MNKIRFQRAALIAAGSLIACVGLFSPPAQAQSSLGYPLQTSSFQQAAPRGFGDRNNSWAQAMVWWNNNLYVGTSRQSTCTSDYAIYQYFGLLLGYDLLNTYLPYPPNDPDLSCPASGTDLALQAEIWRWSPINSGWTRVFQSPATLDNPGPGAPVPAPAGKKVPYDIAIRGFSPYTEPDGTQALYAVGVNSTILWDRTKLPPPRILRTTDGINFSPVPQTPGTFLGDLPFNPDHSSFRSIVSYNGKLFTLCGPAFGQGTLLGSANPSQGDNAWFQASPSGVNFYELKVFNGWLYLGGFDPAGGYAVYKTNAQGPPPYQLITVVPSGAYLTPNPSASVVSMHEYFGRLYVGTATFTEVIRINADDTWELVVGSPRLATTSTGSEWKYPIANLDAGFGTTLNDHAWQMDDPYKYLYIGTYNASTAARLDPTYGSSMLPNMGAHLYVTADSWYFAPITTNGFASSTSPISNTAYATPVDPHGGIFDYGIRTMESTNYGAFMGTANDYYGLAIFRATKRPSPPVDPPYRMELEPTTTGSVLVSWNKSTYAKSYQIWRSEVTPIYVRDNVNVEGWNPTSLNKIADTHVGPYSMVGTSTITSFVDSSAVAGKKYMYYVVGVAASGAVSQPSNLSAYPLLLPSVTYAQLTTQISRLDQRQRFRSPDVHGAAVSAQVNASQASATSCQISTAISQLNSTAASKATLDPDSVDIEILISKMVRRLQMYSLYPQLVISSEFCGGH